MASKGGGQRKQKIALIIKKADPAQEGSSLSSRLFLMGESADISTSLIMGKF